MRTIADIESDWLLFLESRQIRVKCRWFELSLNCDNPEFVPYAKLFYRSLSKKDKRIIEEDRTRATRDFFHYNRYSFKSFMRLYYNHCDSIRR